MSKNPKVVCIGGGTGQASVLAGLKKIGGLEIVSIVGVTDNGGYSGVIRESMGIPQPGDSRNCIGALSDKNLLLTKLINYRFTEGALTGISLGNLFIAALTRITGDFAEAIKETAKLAGVEGKVLPVSIQSTHICAELIDGSVIRGEWEIIKRNPRTRIKKLFLEDPAEALPEALEEIRTADLLVICPGSLCTAIVSTLLPAGMSEAISQSKAPLVYISNIMSQVGQTDDFTLSDHINFIQDYIERSVDYVLFNNKIPDEEILEFYRQENSYPVQLDDHLHNSHTELILDNLLLDLELEHLQKNERPKAEGMHVGSHLVRHSPDSLARILKRFLKNL